MKLYLYADRDEEYKAVATEQEIIRKADDYIQEYNHNGEYGEYFADTSVDGIKKVETLGCAIKVLRLMGVYIKRLTVGLYGEDATTEKLEKYGWMEV